MFRDREKALEDLQKQLWEDASEEENEHLSQEVYDDLDAYNSDKTDTDLEEYSDEVYDPPKSKAGCFLWFSLLTAAVLLAISWYLAKQGGLL